MNTQEIVTQFRLSGWGETVKERIAKGQTVKAFCEENNISASTYYYCQKKVREAACSALVNAERRETQLVPSGWAHVSEIEPETAYKSLTIEIGGCTIKADANTDMELLAKVCRALMRQC